MPAPRVVAVAPGSPAARAGRRRWATRCTAIDGQVPRDIIEWRFLVDERRPGARRRRGAGSSSPVEVDKRAGEPLGRGGAVGAVRPGAHLRQPLRVLLHLPAAAGPAEEPLPEGRRLPAELPLRELHHPHPVHRGRPRAGRHRAAEPAQRVDPRHRSRRPHRDAPQPAGRHEPALAAGPARPRHRGARPGRRVPRASTTARCSTTRSPACSTASPSWRRCASCRSA